MDEQYELHALVFVDMEDFSLHMSRDERRTRGLVRSMQAVITKVVEQYHGRIIKYTGDGAFLSFRSARRAILAALDAQRRVARLQGDKSYRLRIGVHIGEVVLDGSDVYGHAVNLAARVEHAGVVGAVIGSAALRETLASHADLGWASIGVKALKNVGPTELFAVSLRTGGAGPEPLPAEAAFRDLVRKRAAALPWLSGELRRDVTVTDDVIVEVRVERHHEPESCTLHEAVQKHDRLQIAGDPGSGKSTLLARLAVGLLEDPDGPLPVLLHAGSAMKHDLFSAIDERYGSFGPVARLAAQTSRLVVLVDGVDEVPRTDGDLALKHALERWAADAGANRMVVASRPHGEVLLDGFAAARVCPLARDAKRRLLVGLGVPGDRADRALAELLGGGARLAEVSGNPLLLTLAAGILKADGELPGTRERLYERALVLRFARDRLNAWAPPVTDPGATRQRVEDLALRLHGSAEDPWSDAAVEQVVSGWGPGWLDRVARETGLIVKVEGGWAMPHRTLREHLVACALQRQGVTDGELEAAERDEGRWAEVLALVAARLGKDVTGLVARLRTRGEPAAALMWKVLADAEGIAADEVVAAVGLTGGRDAWETRMETLAGLPELLGRRLDLVLDVAERLGRVIVHGAEIWQLREVVGQVRDGLAGTVGPEQTVDAVRARAAALFEQILILHPDRGPTVRDEVRARIEWRRVRAGKSWIGAHPDDPESYDDEKPGRWVEITHDVDLARDPVTNRVYERFDPGHVTERGTSAKRPYAAVHPVVLVSWYEAAAFAAWLGNGIALPDEVVWEHACRAGTTTAYWSGNTEDHLGAVDWYTKNSGGRTHAVGDVPSARANERGLRHLHGNVREWTASGWTPNHKDLPERFDPERPPSAPLADWRVVRGGSWWHVPRFCRSAYRSGWRPSNRSGNLGFRLVRLPASCTEFDR